MTVWCFGAALAGGAIASTFVHLFMARERRRQFDDRLQKYSDAKRKRAQRDD